MVGEESGGDRGSAKHSLAEVVALEGVKEGEGEDEDETLAHEAGRETEQDRARLRPIYIGGQRSEQWRALKKHANDHGIQIIGPASTGNEVLGNFIGIDVTGNVGAGNLQHGIYANSAPSVQVGAMLTDTHNIVSGNGMDGLHLESQNTQILGNYIGVDANATTPSPNLGEGVAVDDGVTNSVESNLVSGNGGNGVFISDDSV